MSESHSVYESVRIGQCQNKKVSELESVITGKCRNWKVSELGLKLFQNILLNNNHR